MIHGVMPDQIRAATAVHPYLEQFTNRGQYTASDIIDQIEQQFRQCWIVVRDDEIKAVALTQIGNDRLNTCQITHLTGTGFRDWQDAFLEVEKWARHLGCKRIEALARPGWERIGKKYGLKKTHVMLEKDLD
jgi:hypothetical protein